jgi:flagellar protein FlgJ
MNPSRDRRLAEVAGIAVRLEAETGIPARMLIAQWAIESRWGAQPAGKANHFGIKRAKRHTKCCTVVTREVVAGAEVVGKLEFADYDSLEDSCRDYVWLITHGAPYREAWRRYRETGDVAALIASVARVYATAPHYARMVLEIAGQANVAAAIAAARKVNGHA